MFVFVIFVYCVIVKTNPVFFRSRFVCVIFFSLVGPPCERTKSQTTSPPLKCDHKKKNHKSHKTHPLEMSTSAPTAASDDRSGQAFPEATRGQTAEEMERDRVEADYQYCRQRALERGEPDPDLEYRPTVAEGSSGSGGAAAARDTKENVSAPQSPHAHAAERQRVLEQWMRPHVPSAEEREAEQRGVARTMAYLMSAGVLGPEVNESGCSDSDSDGDRAGDAALDKEDDGGNGDDVRSRRPMWRLPPEDPIAKQKQYAWARRYHARHRRIRADAERPVNYIVIHPQFQHAAIPGEWARIWSMVQAAHRQRDAMAARAAAATADPGSGKRKRDETARANSVGPKRHRSAPEFAEEKAEEEDHEVEADDVEQEEDEKKVEEKEERPRRRRSGKGSACSPKPRTKISTIRLAPDAFRVRGRREGRAAGAGRWARRVRSVALPVCRYASSRTAKPQRSRGVMGKLPSANVTYTVASSPPTACR